METQTFGISIKSLYEKHPYLKFCEIIPDHDEFGKMVYYDLYNDQGLLACCDGEECMIISEDDSSITLATIEPMSAEGDDAINFRLTKEEFKTATFS